jgi:DNA-binding SARP family transcriptional activator
MEKLKISLFDPFPVLLNSSLVTRFESVNVRALPAYLAVEAVHSQPGESLASPLWLD